MGIKFTSQVKIVPILQISIATGATAIRISFRPAAKTEHRVSNVLQ